MKKCKSGWSYSFGAETTIDDGRIHYRPDIVLFGDFHEGVGRLVLDILNSRITEILSDLSKNLAKPDDFSDEEDLDT